MTYITKTSLIALDKSQSQKTWIVNEKTKTKYGFILWLINIVHVLSFTIVMWLIWWTIIMNDVLPSVKKFGYFKIIFMSSWKNWYCPFWMVLAHDMWHNKIVPLWLVQPMAFAFYFFGCFINVSNQPCYIVYSMKGRTKYMGYIL